MELTIILIYFALTSLSTVGLGDFFPISSSERLMGSFMILFGVAIFSYAESQLGEILMESLKMDDDDHQLGRFFSTVEYLSKGRS